MILFLAVGVAVIAVAVLLMVNAVTKALYWTRANREGAIDITFGNRTNKFITGKTLTLRPAVVQAAPVVPIAWVCGKAATPDKMTVMGADTTNLPPSHLPIDCRG